jgi:hypothetical protein
MDQKSMDVLSDLTFQLPDKEVVAVVAVEDSATAVVVVVSETVAAVASVVAEDLVTAVVAVVSETVAVVASVVAVVVVVSETVAAEASIPLRGDPSNLMQAQRQPSE